MTTVGSLIDQTVNTLETNMRDPASTRIGSFVLKPAQEISNARYFPQLKVHPARTDPMENPSFGRPRVRDRLKTLHIYIYTQKGIRDKDTGLQNEEFLHDFSEELSDTLETHSGSIHDAFITDFGTVEPSIFFLPNDVMMTILPVEFLERR